VIWNRFLKFFTSSYLTFILIVISYLVCVAIFVIVCLAERVFVCTFTTLLALKTLNNIELIIIYGLILLTLLSDIIPHWKMILKFQWIQYIFYSDPYYFRAQIVLFLPFMIYSIVIEFVSLALTTTYSDVVRNFGVTIILNTTTRRMFDRYQFIYHAPGRRACSSGEHNHLGRPDNYPINSFCHEKTCNWSAECNNIRIGFDTIFAFKFDQAKCDVSERSDSECWKSD
jgi:hypothetical protein